MRGLQHQSGEYELIAAWLFSSAWKLSNITENTTDVLHRIGGELYSVRPRGRSAFSFDFKCWALVRCCRSIDQTRDKGCNARCTWSRRTCAAIHWSRIMISTRWKAGSGFVRFVRVDRLMWILRRPLAFFAPIEIIIKFLDGSSLAKVHSSVFNISRLSAICIFSLITNGLRKL